MLKLILRLILCAALPIALGASGCPGRGGGNSPGAGFADHN